MRARVLISDANNQNLTDAYRAYERLLTHQSLMLAMINKDGSPLISYAPYLINEHNR